MELIERYNGHLFLFEEVKCILAKSIQLKWLEPSHAAGTFISRFDSQKYQLKYFNTYKGNYNYKDKANTDLLKAYRPFLVRKCTGYFSRLPFLS
jgi:hypothetical protein